MNPEDYFHYLDDKLEPLSDDRIITYNGFINYSKIAGQTEYIKNNPEFMCITLVGSRWNNAIIRAIDAYNVKIIGEKSSILFFSTANLCPMILNMLTSVLLFKEKLSFKQWIGISFGILSTVFVSGILGC